MNLFKFTLVSVFICFTGCGKKTNKPSSHNHTTKLTRPLAVSFLTSDEIKITQKNSAHVSLKVFLNSAKEKTLVNSISGLQAGVHQLELPDTISDFSYIIAVVQSTDSNGNLMSAVDTYKIDEQELINSAKQVLKNRN